MRTSFLFIVACYTSMNAFSQADSLYAKRINSQFKGGMNGWEAFCNKNLELPKEVKENNMQGIVVISFILDEAGKVKNPVIENSVCEACDHEALRILSLSSDKWKPWMEKDTPVAQYMEVSVSFDAVPRADLKPMKEQVSELYDNKKYQEALTLINKIIRNQPYDTDFMMGKGLTLQALGRTEEACKAFKRSIFLGNKESEQYFNQYCN